MKKKSFLILVCCLLCLTLFPYSAAAHAYILKSTPVQDSELKESPKEIRVTFTEKIDVSLSQLILYDQKGSTVKTTQSSEDDITLVLKVPSLEKGIYKVVWQILSLDSHVTDGSFRFSVGTAIQEQKPDETQSLDDPAPAPPSNGNSNTGGQTPPKPAGSSSPGSKPGAGTGTTKPSTTKPAATKPAATKPATNSNSVPPQKNSNQNRNNPSSSGQETPANRNAGQDSAEDITSANDDKQANSNTSTENEPENEPSNPEKNNESSSPDGNEQTSDGYAVDETASDENTEQERSLLNEYHNHQRNDKTDWNTVLRILEILAAVVIAGYVFFRNWILRSEDSGIAFWFNPNIERIVILVGLVLFAATGTAHVLLLAQQLSGHAFGEPEFWNRAGRILSSSLVGQVSWIRSVILLVLLLTAIRITPRSRGGAAVKLLLLVGFAVTFPLTGHAASGESVVIPAVSHTIHLLAAGIWFGGLFGLMSLSFVKSRDAGLLHLLNLLLKRFSAVALPMIVLVSLSGIVLSLYRLGSWSDLIESTYGQILLWKVIIFSLTLGVAAFHRLIMMPRIDRLAQSQEPSNRTVVEKLFFGIQLELLLALILFVLAGLLSTGSPP